MKHQKNFEVKPVVHLVQSGIRAFLFELNCEVFLFGQFLHFFHVIKLSHFWRLAKFDHLNQRRRVFWTNVHQLQYFYAPSVQNAPIFYIRRQVELTSWFFLP